MQRALWLSLFLLFTIFPFNHVVFAEATIDPILFDKPIHTLEFIGIKTNKIGIDDLVVNLSQPGGDLEDQLGAQEATQLASFSEPSWLLMLGVGFLAVSWVSRRLSAKSTSPSSTTKDQQQT